MCFFAVPFDRLGLYREYLFPVAAAAGYTPAAADEVVSPAGTFIAKGQALLAAADAVVVDISTTFGLFELGVARSVRGRVSEGPPQADTSPDDIFVVGDEGQALPADLADIDIAVLPSVEDMSSLAAAFQQWLRPRRARLAMFDPVRECDRLIAEGHWTAAVLTAWIAIERRLRDRLAATWRGSATPSGGVRALIEQVRVDGLIDGVLEDDLLALQRLRNSVAHGIEPATEEQARMAVDTLIRAMHQVPPATQQG